VNELAACRFVSEIKNMLMLGILEKEKTLMAIELGLKQFASGLTVFLKQPKHLLN